MNEIKRRYYKCSIMDGAMLCVKYIKQADKDDNLYDKWKYDCDLKFMCKFKNNCPIYRNLPSEKRIE